MLVFNPVTCNKGCKEKYNFEKASYISDKDSEPY